MNDIQLRAGPLQMILEANTGFLRYLRVGEREVVRGIYGAVRDRDWDTVAPVIGDVVVTSREEEFQVTFTARCRAADIGFMWLGEITGQPDGTVRYVFDGKAEGPCLKNRIGLCVLHPIAECAGAPCRVEHTDGAMTEGEFPRFISPDQPFKNLRAITHPVTPEQGCTVRFEGEPFEMEDQRNWTDASFKTYSTPLELPFPVLLESGARVRHVVTVSLDPKVARDPNPVHFPAVQSKPDVAEVRVDWSNGLARPGVGFGLAWPYGSSSETARQRLKNLRPDHLRVDIDLNARGWFLKLPNSAAFASLIGCPLQVAFMFPEDNTHALGALGATKELSPASVYLVYQAGHGTTPTELVDLVRKHVIKQDGTPLLAAGTNAYFAEVNRQRLPSDLDALTCFSFNPQVHAFDDRSLIETLEAQCALVESARAFRSQRVVISPITLRPRFNPYTTAPGEPREPESDPRQATPFCALWTLGTLGRLLPCPGVHSLTFYETHGPRGLMTKAGRLYPVAHVFAALSGFPFVCESSSTRPRDAVALALRTEAGDARLVVGAFNAQRMHVDLPKWAGGSQLRKLGLPTEVKVGALRDHRLELDLPPGGLAVIDLEAQ